MFVDHRDKAPSKVPVQSPPKGAFFMGNNRFAGLIQYNSFTQARSSVGERFLDTEEVGSSILPVPTIF
jgi:hypothetical protein